MCVGDCLVQGFNPPESAIVIQDSVPGDTTDQKGGVPLLRPPHGYERIFQDEQSRNDKQLSIWKPVPMPGSAPGLLHITITGSLLTCPPFCDIK